MTRAKTLLVILLAALGVLVSRVPHLRLAVQLASGQLDGRRIPVTDFVPAGFQEKSTSHCLDRLVFEAPERARVQRVPLGDTFVVWLDLDGMTCCVMPPREETEEDEPNPWDESATFGEAELRRRAAICASSEQDLSFWMGPAGVQQLHEQLELRPAFALAAERVEVVRGSTLSGLLLTWKTEDVTQMAFTFFSPDKRINGSVLLRLHSESPESVRTARAIVSSFRLQPCSQVPRGSHLLEEHL